MTDYIRGGLIGYHTVIPWMGMWAVPFISRISYMGEKPAMGGVSFININVCI